MVRKRLVVALSVVIAFPISGAMGFSVAEWLDMRFVFVGARSSLWVLLLGIVFSAAFFAVGMFGLWRLLRAIPD